MKLDFSYFLTYSTRQLTPSGLLALARPLTQGKVGRRKQPCLQYLIGLHQLFPLFIFIKFALSFHYIRYKTAFYFLEGWTPPTYLTQAPSTATTHLGILETVVPPVHQIHDYLSHWIKSVQVKTQPQAFLRAFKEFLMKPSEFPVLRVIIKKETSGLRWILIISINAFSYNRTLLYSDIRQGFFGISGIMCLFLLLLHGQLTNLRFG